MIDLEQMRQRAALCAEVTLPGEMLRELLDHIAELEARLTESEKAAYDIDETIQHQKQRIAELEAEVESYRCGNGGIVVVSRTDKDPAA